MEPSEEQTRDVLDHVDIPEPMIPAIAKLMTDNLHIFQMLIEAHEKTWFFVHQDAACAAPRPRPRPG
eukprot:1245349-Pyramimonas_sp.AAC.1